MPGAATPGCLRARAEQAVAPSSLLMRSCCSRGCRHSSSPSSCSRRSTAEERRQRRCLTRAVMLLQQGSLAGRLAGPCCRSKWNSTRRCHSSSNGVTGPPPMLMSENLAVHAPGVTYKVQLQTDVRMGVCFSATTAEQAPLTNALVPPNKALLINRMASWSLRTRSGLAKCVRGTTGGAVHGPVPLQHTCTIPQATRRASCCVQLQPSVLKYRTPGTTVNWEAATMLLP